MRLALYAYTGCMSTQVGAQPVPEAMPGGREQEGRGPSDTAQTRGLWSVRCGLWTMVTPIFLKGLQAPTAKPCELEGFVGLARRQVTGKPCKTM